MLSCPVPCPGVCGQTQASLREENDSLRWQLDAYRNEVELLRKEQGKAYRPDDEHTHTHEGQLQLLQQSMHNMQQVHTRTHTHIHAHAHKTWIADAVSAPVSRTFSYPQNNSSRAETASFLLVLTLLST